jgi:F0F1-type ATP synthase assembly protein I
VLEDALNDERKPRSAWAEALRISDLGLRLVVAVGVGFWAGLWLDRKLGLADRFPAFTMLFAILGFTGGMIALVRGLTKVPRASGPPDRGGPDAGGEDEG